MDRSRDEEAMRPLEEAGQGEAEGFEIAEQDLIDNAEYQNEEGIPELDQFESEPEEGEPGDYGEADEERVAD